MTLEPRDHERIFEAMRALSTASGKLSVIGNHLAADGDNAGANVIWEWADRITSAFTALADIRATASVSHRLDRSHP